jgi:hypothetical protein
VIIAVRSKEAKLPTREQGIFLEYKNKNRKLKITSRYCTDWGKDQISNDVCGVAPGTLKHRKRAEAEYVGWLGGL